MRAFYERFTSYYFDINFLPRSRYRAFLDIFPALLFAIRGK